MNCGYPPRLAVRAEVIDGIAKHGFHVVGIRTTISESIVSSPPHKKGR